MGAPWGHSGNGAQSVHHSQPAGQVESDVRLARSVCVLVCLCLCMSRGRGQVMLKVKLG